jgi:hypothetical protein
MVSVRGPQPWPVVSTHAASSLFSSGRDRPAAPELAAADERFPTWPGGIAVSPILR